MRKKKVKLSFHGGFVTLVKHLRCSSEGLFAGSHARKKGEKGEKEKKKRWMSPSGRMAICLTRSALKCSHHHIGLELHWSSSGNISSQNGRQCKEWEPTLSWTRLRTTMQNSDWRYTAQNMTLTCCQDHILTENIWFVWSETSYSGDERRCHGCGTNDKHWR